MTSVRIHGAALDYTTEGDGPKVLSLGAPAYYQRVYSKELRGELEITFGNLRHWVPSLDGVDASSITLDIYADDIEAVRAAAVGDEPVVVMGHSIHGALALEYARRYPQSVRGVVAVAAPPVATPALAEAAARFWDVDASAERKAAHAENLTTRPMPSTVASGQDVVDLYVANGAMYWNDPRYDATWLWQDSDTNMDVFIHLMYGLFGDWQLKPVAVPVLAQVGRHDYVIPHDLWSQVVADVGGIELKEYGQSGHTPPLDEPAAFDRDLVTFVKGLG